MVDSRLGFSWRSIGGEDAATEGRRPTRHLTSDPAITDDAERTAAHLTVWCTAPHPARAPGSMFAELARNLEQPVAPREHYHHDVFGNGTLVPERVADRDPDGQRCE